MKKLLSVILAAALVLLSIPVSAAPISPCDEGLSLSATELVLPMFSSSTGERLRVYYDGELVPASYFTWSSTDTSVVTVNSQGSLTAVAPGTATVIVSDESSSAECVITVVEDDDFTRIADLPFTSLALPYYSEEVGIGPLGGAEPVIIKRFINPPSCSCENPPDPNDLIVDEGWLYTYAVLYRVHAVYGQTIHFTTSASDAEGHAAGAYITLYDQFFNIWDFDHGTASNPFGSVTLTSYEDGYFYVAITPINHTNDSYSGTICLNVYDPDAPDIVPGDVNSDGLLSFADVSSLYMFVLGLAPEASAAADFDGSGSVDFVDIAMLYQSILNG